MSARNAGGVRIDRDDRGAADCPTLEGASLACDIERMSDDQPKRPDALFTAIEVLRRRWSPAILQALSDIPVHYMALHRRVPGLSQKVLTQHLRLLETACVIRRDSQSDRTRVYYALTARGEALHRLIEALRDWDAQ